MELQFYPAAADFRSFVRSGAPAAAALRPSDDVRRAAKQFFCDFFSRTQQGKILWPKDGANFVCYSSVPRSLSHSISAIFRCSAAAFVSVYTYYAGGGSGRLIA